MRLGFYTSATLKTQASETGAVGQAVHILERFVHAQILMIILSLRHSVISNGTALVRPSPIQKLDDDGKCGGYSVHATSIA